MFMIELNDFYNDGFGWICRHCERDLVHPAESSDTRSRIMREGETESKQPEMSNLALAKWADPEHRTLLCPRCGISELAEKS